MPDEQNPSQPTVTAQPPVHGVRPEPPADGVQPEPPMPVEPAAPAISMPPNKSSGTAADIPVKPVSIDLSPEPSTSAAPATSGQPFGTGTPAGTANADVGISPPAQDAPSQASKKLVLLTSLVILGLAVAGGVTVAALSIHK